MLAVVGQTVGPIRLNILRETLNGVTSMAKKIKFFFNFFFYFTDNAGHFRVKKLFSPRQAATLINGLFKGKHNFLVFRGKIFTRPTFLHCPPPPRIRLGKGSTFNFCLLRKYKRTILDLKDCFEFLTLSINRL